MAPPDAAPVRLRVSLVQTESSLDPALNLARLDEAAQLAAGSDLVVFPEAFARDFGKPGSDLAAYAEPLDGPFVSRLREVSDANDVAVLAGMFEQGTESGSGRTHPFNTLVLADRGTLTTYRKIHLYDSFGYRESDTVSPGPLEPVVADVRGFKVGLMTCYDLRFPELARALSSAGAEVIVVPAAWVAGNRKASHWTTLLRARAIENLAFVVGCAQCGPRYTGFSTVISPNGDVLVQAENEETVLLATLEHREVEDARSGNPSLANRRL
jgi:predicted amidohydrolase